MKISVITVTYQSVGTLEEAALRNLRQQRRPAGGRRRPVSTWRPARRNMWNFLKVYDENINFQNIQK